MSPPLPDGTKGVMQWRNLVSQAFAERVNLTVTFNAKLPGGEDALPVGTYKTRDQQPDIPGYDVLKPDSDPFHYPSNPAAPDKFSGFTFSAACSEVEVDVLTGEVKILSSTIVYDIGWSVNPALDVCQIEGAFMMGVGYVLSEKVIYEDRPDNPDYGRISTVNTWRYKPPATTTVPLNLDVYLYPRASEDGADLPENPNDFFSAKEVGEPPLILATTVFFAVKDAVRSYRKQTGQSVLFEMNAPANVQEVRRVCGTTF